MTNNRAFQVWTWISCRKYPRAKFSNAVNVGFRGTVAAKKEIKLTLYPFFLLPFILLVSRRRRRAILKLEMDP